MTNSDPDDRIVSSHEIKKELDNIPPQKFHASKLPFLDKLVGGFAAGDFVVLGGNTGAGKTTFLQTVTRNFAQQDIGCLWFSVELSYREFLGRFGKNLPVFYVPRIMPNVTTHEWIEGKILEAKKTHDIQIVFIDHIGMVVDEKVAWSANSIDIFDARIFRLKRFALKNQVCIVAVAPLVQTHLRSKKKEPSEGDFRGSAMIAYTADTLLHLERLEGRSAFMTVNEEFPRLDDMDGYQIPTDSNLYIIKSRRTGGEKEINPTERGKQAFDDPTGRNRAVAAKTVCYQCEKCAVENTAVLGCADDEIDILTGGFPCQPFSQPGRRKGTVDDRHLWPEMLRVIREFKPRWVVGENVGGFITWGEGVVLEQVCSDLEGEGYEVQPFVIPAVAVNAPHRRDRVWIVAHATASNARCERQEKPKEQATGSKQYHKDDSDTERPGRSRGGSKDERRLGQSDRYGSDKGRDWNSNWLEVATELCRVDDGLSSRLVRLPDGRKISYSKWRQEALKGLGNAWVPQVAIEILKVIKRIDL